MTKEQVKQIKKIIDKLEDEENTIFTTEEYQKVLLEVLKRQGFTLKEFNEANKEKSIPNVLLQGEELKKDVKIIIDDIIKPINEAITKLQTKKIKYQELLGLPHIPTINEIQALIPPILTKDDVLAMIPELPKPKEHPQTIKDLNEAKKERDELWKAMDKLDKKKLKLKIKKRDLSDFVKRTDLNAFVQTEEVHKLQQNLKKLITEAAAPALFRIDNLMTKLSAQPVDLSVQCDGSNKTFDTPSDIQSILWVYLNGGFLAEGNEFTRTGPRTITLTFAPNSGEELWIKYISA